MSDVGDSISSALQRVGAERARRRAVPGLYAQVAAVKAFQQRRFADTYADLLVQDRYALALHFFQDELYGPRDYDERDRQFARVVPALVRLFPREVVLTVRALVELHEVSESLDTAMGEHVQAHAIDPLDAVTYVRAWNQTARAQDRERQIRLTLEVGHDLDRLTRKALLRNSLRLMRGPAKAAGLADLQTVLENGFDAFKAMHGSADFLAIVASRERQLMQSLFGVGAEIISAVQATTLFHPNTPSPR